MSANDLRKLKNKKSKENQKKLLTKNNNNVKINIENKKGEKKKWKLKILNLMK